MKYRDIEQYDFQLMENVNFPVNMPDNLYDGESIVCRFITIGDNRLYIAKHYCWDGSSIPLKKSWRWLFDSDKYCKEASLVHDALCQLIRNGLLPLRYRIDADKYYQDMCMNYGMPKWQAKLRYRALRMFGGKTVNKTANPIKEV
jgi:hypothetical protein